MRWCSVPLLFLILACGSEPEEMVADIVVARQDYHIAVHAEGRAHAVTATPINVPANMRAGFTIAWLVPEGTVVEEGDVLVRFDEAQLRVQERDHRDQLTLIDHDLDITRRGNDQISNQIEGDLTVTEEERRRAETFAPRDRHLFSREEIIEGEVNLAFLDEKIDFLDGNRGRHTRKAEAEEQIKRLEKQSRSLQLDQVEEMMEHLILRAPHGGAFYYRRNWRGEGPRVGEQVWPGHQLGELPDLSEVEARVFVLEAEAAGLEPGLEASLVFAARPDETHRGKVKSVAGLAVPLERNSPVKYFEVVIAVDETVPEVMKPGGSVAVEITLDRREDVLVVPNQCLYEEEGEHWVYVRSGEGFEKRPVEVDKRGPTRSVISTGLEEGDRVALAQVEQQP